MDLIDEPKELLKLIYEDGWKHRSSNPYISSDYKTLTYQCGCGEHHILRDTPFTLIAFPVKFIFHCRNDFLTAVRVKGFFTQKAISKWSCTLDVFDAMEEYKRRTLELLNEAQKENDQK